MTTQPTLSDREWELVLDLLQTERRNLPQEIRHTDTPRVEKALEDRLHLIDELIGRLQGAVAH